MDNSSVDNIISHFICNQNFKCDLNDIYKQKVISFVIFLKGFLKNK